MTTIYVKNGTPTDAQSQCATCIHAHIMRGFRESEEVTYCTVGYGAPMIVPFRIYQCSSHMDRTRPTWKQMEDLAIDILPLSSTAAKPAGFRKQKEADSVEEVEPETINR